MRVPQRLMNGGFDSSTDMLQLWRSLICVQFLPDQQTWRRDLPRGGAWRGRVGREWEREVAKGKGGCRGEGEVTMEKECEG